MALMSKKQFLSYKNAYILDNLENMNDATKPPMLEVNGIKPIRNP
jgi:hypothetical protein